ncbi:unnamed protein product [Acanthoscelides obtectus]|uniref:Uncharacterized protein n=1 Tax=Acanthoscelides obtectus TaxID=200917 RepID=A0A9P0P5M5_ACAOB|nr:unnamed protein product [Acanthoscelides obtectus]CAK1649295.1 hypothetical protein AOBTE_LOCUS16136 [Acanthoscelides obtectus]
MAHISSERSSVHRLLEATKCNFADVGIVFSQTTVDLENARNNSYRKMHSKIRSASPLCRFAVSPPACSTSFSPYHPPPASQPSLSHPQRPAAMMLASTAR